MIDRNSNSKLQRKLRIARLSNTKCRLAILKVLTETRSPLTQDQIAKKLGKQRSDKATIYRTLEKFISNGLVHRAFTDSRSQYFELADNCTESQCHPHFTCTICGNTLCLTDLNVPLLKMRNDAFHVTNQQIRLEGLCPQCAGK